MDVIYNIDGENYKLINRDINTNINIYDNVKIKYSYGNTRFGYFTCFTYVKHFDILSKRNMIILLSLKINILEYVEYNNTFYINNVNPLYIDKYFKKL